LKEVLQRALGWRLEQSDLSGLTTLRLFSGASDGCKGLWIDRYGPLVVVSLYRSELVAHKKLMVEFLEKNFPGVEVLFKIKGSDQSFQAELNGLSQREFICSELGCDYKIKTELEHDFGLFIDTHAARHWLSEHAEGKEILNLFSYSCAFGVVGMKYGAKQVTNIDPNRSYLDWGKSNAQLNHLDFRNLCDPAQKYLPRHCRRLKEGKDQTYDIVIADPPAFLVGRGDDRLGRKLWPKLLDWFVEMRPKTIILICNDRSFRLGREMKPYFSDRLQGKYALKQLDHRADLKGQNVLALTMQEDYLPPDIFIAQRRG